LQGGKVESRFEDLLFYLGKVVERLCFIEAVAGTAGNISVRADDFPVEEFPQIGAREKTVHQMDGDFSGLHNKKFVITGSGKNLRYIAHRPHLCLAVVEIVPGGYKMLWGLQEGEKITSEHPAHFAIYQRRPKISAVIHGQPTSVNVLVRLFRSEKSLNSLMFVQHEQLQICCPGGIGLVEKVEHGSYELADAVATSLESKDICAVVRHGTFSAGEGNSIDGLNRACDLQEYYHDAARTFLDNPWLRLLPFDFMVKNLKRVSRLPLGDRLVNGFLRPPK
jgi:ribulose-5-phosphate 4-epimerase/fuculose-1-phosphate aldolase